jgi:hypothetical protein
MPIIVYLYLMQKNQSHSSLVSHSFTVFVRCNLYIFVDAEPL